MMNRFYEQIRKEFENHPNLVGSFNFRKLPCGNEYIHPYTEYLWRGFKLRAELTGDLEYKLSQSVDVGILLEKDDKLAALFELYTTLSNKYESVLIESLQWIEHTGNLDNRNDTRTCYDKYDGCFKCKVYDLLGGLNANDKKD